MDDDVTEFENRTFANAKSKLRWGSGGVWSVSILPEEARVLLGFIEKMEEPTGTTDDRDMSQ